MDSSFDFGRTIEEVETEGEVEEGSAATERRRLVVATPSSNRRRKKFGEGKGEKN